MEVSRSCPRRASDRGDQTRLRLYQGVLPRLGEKPASARGGVCAGEPVHEAEALAPSPGGVICPSTERDALRTDSRALALCPGASVWPFTSHCRPGSHAQHDLFRPSLDLLLVLASSSVGLERRPRETTGEPLGTRPEAASRVRRVRVCACEPRLSTRWAGSPWGRWEPTSW